MAAPSTTKGTAGNGLASTSIAASGTTTFTLDVTANFEFQLQVGATFGTVAAINGLRVDVFDRAGSTPVAATVAGQSYTLAGVAASALATPSIRLQTGQYLIKLTNLDGTNGLTSVYSTYDSITAVA